MYKTKSEVLKRAEAICWANMTMRVRGPSYLVPSVSVKEIIFDQYGGFAPHPKINSEHIHTWSVSWDKLGLNFKEYMELPDDLVFDKLFGKGSDESMAKAVKDSVSNHKGVEKLADKIRQKQKKLVQEWFEAEIGPMIAEAADEFKKEVIFSFPIKHADEDNETNFIELFWNHVEEELGFVGDEIGSIDNPKPGCSNVGVRISW